MDAKVQVNLPQLYESDFVRWVETTMAQLLTQDYAQVDWTNLIEELEDMTRRERKSLKSNLIVVLLHLLKWQYQPQFRGGSWRGSMREHRRRINEDLQDSPSLVPFFETVFAECYTQARAQAADETELPLGTFPIQCPYTPEQVLNPDYLPN
ncbi:DUF29 family protein [Synechococcales cyanobacterium C]|uniref:DUF29 family protein n=1 Tax=Petrachloros mirabilis ULC683 TaxID=2781853 RepID=A0A8K2A051_9CYAN|nr:DUF29 domain-containing protein [Petrachloros mirabilis]NCJ07136.1 DUF29 family protein [Petrachloros mirabilis ULC683]